MNGFDLEPCVAAGSVADIAHIERLCDIGRFQDAYEQALRLGPLEEWRGPQALALASRLLRHLGAQRLARVFRLARLACRPTQLCRLSGAWARAVVAARTLFRLALDPSAGSAPRHRR